MLSGLITKPEAILTYEYMVPHFSINDRHLRKHAELDRPTVHVFAQLQAVVLNLFTLNALLGAPLEPIRIHEHYNGLFVHNLFQTLRLRKDPLEYIKGTVYRYSGASFEIHRMLYGWLVKFLPQLEDHLPMVVIQQKPKRSLQRKKKQPKQVVVNDCLEDADPDDVKNDDEQVKYNDVNNLFSQLLLNDQ